MIIFPFFYLYYYMRNNISNLEKKFVGKSYFYLTVLEVIEIDSVFKLKCQCKCGSIHFISQRKFGVTKSCGCYQKSDEYKSLRKEWSKLHRDDLLDKGKRYSQWCKDNPDKLNKRNENIKKSWTIDKRRQFSGSRKNYYRNNENKKDSIKHRVEQWWSNADSDKRNQIVLHHKKAKLQTRISHINDEFISNLHPSYIEKLNCGEIKIDSIIETKCPKCGKYDSHSFNNVYHLKSETYTPRMCSSCYKSFSTSKYEDEIADYISTFYSGKLVRNDRSVLSGKELDLYYPEKKIAIEFNGDYWHNESRVDSDYHYNKFKKCFDNGITLVSIFEHEWLSNKDLIKEYLVDLFNGVENKLSFISNNIMNNNYPLHKRIIITDTIEDTYRLNNYTIHRCGFSKFKYE